MRWLVSLAVGCGVLVSTPRAGEAQSLSISAPRRDNLVYVELLGKGGLYGVGYERALGSRFHIGAAVSAFWLYGQRVLTASPYAGIDILRDERHGWFAQLGPKLTSISMAVDVPEWDGGTETGIGGELTTGWEYRNRIVVRVAGSVIVGPGGVTPWLGASVGIEL